jgi:hypothetical protein
VGDHFRERRRESYDILPPSTYVSRGNKILTALKSGNGHKYPFQSISLPQALSPSESSPRSPHPASLTGQDLLIRAAPLPTRLAPRAQLLLRLGSPPSPRPASCSPKHLTGQLPARRQPKPRTSPARSISLSTAPFFPASPARSSSPSTASLLRVSKV